MRAIQLLGQLADDVGAGRVSQPSELTQMLFEGLSRAGPLERRAHEQRAFDRRLDSDEIAGDESLWWQVELSLNT
jgi:hypothetical protein